MVKAFYQRQIPSVTTAIFLNILNLRCEVEPPLFGFANRGVVIELVTAGAFFAICRTSLPFVFCSTRSAFYLVLFLWLTSMLRLLNGIYRFSSFNSFIYLF